MGTFTRREFLKASAGTCAAFGASRILAGVPKLSAATSTVHAVLGDQLSDLYQMAGDAAQAVGIGSGSVNMSGTRVFIKPNLICMGEGGFNPISGDSTKAEIVVGVAEQCLLAGADKVTIGDAAHAISWDWRTYDFFEGNTIFGTTNIQDAVSYLQAAYPSQEIELACLHEVDEWEYIPSSSTEEPLSMGLKLGKSFCDADHMISIAVLKNHQWTDISGSMKNLVGTLYGLIPFGYSDGPESLLRTPVHAAYSNISSGGFDQVGIPGAFTDIIKWRQEQGKQDFAIIDGSLGIEGNGTRPYPWNLGKTIDIKARSNIGKYFVLASDDFVAADAANVRIMNQAVETIRQLVMASNLGLGEINDISLAGASIEELLIPDWEAASQVTEWGLASTVPATLHGTGTRQRSRMVNTMTGLALPAAMIGGFRAWHQRKPPCCKPKPPVPTPVVKE